jgi:hypothetical protein
MDKIGILFSNSHVRIENCTTATVSLVAKTISQTGFTCKVTFSLYFTNWIYLQSNVFTHITNRIYLQSNFFTRFHKPDLPSFPTRSKKTGFTRKLLEVLGSPPKKCAPMHLNFCAWNQS